MRKISRVTIFDPLHSKIHRCKITEARSVVKLCVYTGGHNDFIDAINPPGIVCYIFLFGSLFHSIDADLQ
jgi:hypothetical protein